MHLINTVIKNNRYLHSIIILLIAACCFFLTFNRHSKTGKFEYRSEIWADKAGYYVYLPALFKFNLDPHQFPDSIDAMTGYGFRLDYENTVVVTKYYYGVALLQLPFFVVADFFAERKNETPAGFGTSHHRMINVASVFYLIVGLVFLGLFLGKKYKVSTVYLTLFSLLAASHLYYYAIDETGMSHVYSFAAFAVFLYYSQHNNYLENAGVLPAFIFGLLCGLIIILRPLNLFFLVFFFFLKISNRKEFTERLKNVFKPGILFPITLGIILMLIPQFLYYYFTHGKLLNDPYPHESFDFSNPNLILLWFAAYNGMFPYTPLYLVVLVSSVAMFKKHKGESLFIILLFFVFSYILSCWWVWHFGCSFGARNFVEYLALFSLPLAFAIDKINRKKIAIIISFWMVIAILTVHNLLLIYAFDECFFGEIWDWKSYFKYFRI